MPTMQDSVSVAANGISVNQLAGQTFEFVPAGVAMVLSCTGSATGLRVTLIVGGITLINDQAIGLQNRFPLIPDDVMHQGPTPGGRVELRFRNTTAGALTAFWRIDL